METFQHILWRVECSQFLFLAMSFTGPTVLLILVTMGNEI